MGEYADYYIDEHIHEWDGGFESYDIKKTNLVILMDKYLNIIKEIKDKYGFLIRPTLKKGQTGMKEALSQDSFAAGVILFYEERGYATKKQLEKLQLLGEGYYQ